MLALFLRHFTSREYVLLHSRLQRMPNHPARDCSSRRAMADLRTGHLDVLGWLKLNTR